MKKLTCVLAGLAFASTAALATDVKQNKQTTPGVSATQMSDSEMDRVTAGFTPPTPGFGVNTAAQASNIKPVPGADAVPLGKGLGQGTLPGPAAP
jgi:hypothetical protein